MVKISGTTITMTRGDSLVVLLALENEDGTVYEPNEGDYIRFAMKKSFDDSVPPILVKEIPTDTMTLVLDPEDTKQLRYGQYRYDIQITTADGLVDTFIDRAVLAITEEVD